MSPNSLLTVSDAAKRLNVSTSTVRTFTLTGKLRIAAKTASGMRLFDVDDVEALVHQRAQRQPAAAQPTV